MSLHSLVNTRSLDTGLILAPERYDPRRDVGEHFDYFLSDVADVISEQKATGKFNKDDRFLVLDTTHAKEGLILFTGPSCDHESIKSAKKVIQPGDVIVSRLRPYLRQVAYIDEGLSKDEEGTLTLLCSTEFFVLRSRNKESIAFLVPLLLSENVQKVLAASQEGGHHPRFNRETLIRIPIPDRIWTSHNDISAKVEKAAETIRKEIIELNICTSECNA
jgi:restriction endonuclease S subunit